MGCNVVNCVFRQSLKESIESNSCEAEQRCASSQVSNCVMNRKFAIRCGHTMAASLIRTDRGGVFK